MGTDLIYYLRNIEPLSLEMLQKISRVQAGRKQRSKNRPIDANWDVAWDSVNVGQWRIQQKKFVRKICKGSLKPRLLLDENCCRILDDEDRVDSIGSAEEYILLIQDVRRESKVQSSADTTGYGLVFEGGGGKGAFEIGVWRYLHERGIDKYITGVSGASVGALNSLLFVNGDYELAENLWANIEQGDMTPLNWVKLYELLFPLGKIRTMAGEPISNYLLALSSLARQAGIFNHNTQTGIFSQQKLEKLINEEINWHRINDSPVIAYCSLSFLQSASMNTAACLNLDSRDMLIKLLRKFTRAEYCCWNKMEPDQIKNLILASAALPVAYGSRTVQGNEYLDGGIQDNCPVKPLVENGFKKIIVVHLHQPDKWNADNKWDNSVKGLDCRNIEFLHVYPNDSSYNDLSETMKVNPNVCCKRMMQGYTEAKEQLSDLL